TARRERRIGKPAPHTATVVLNRAAMGKLTRRARAKADYFGFIGAREWPLAASGVGVALGVVTILPSAVGVVLSVVALALGVATFTRDVRLLRRRWAGFEFTTIAAP